MVLASKSRTRSWSSALLLVILLVTSRLAAADLQTRIGEYEEAKREVLRSPSRGKGKGKGKSRRNRSSGDVERLAALLTAILRSPGNPPLAYVRREFGQADSRVVAAAARAMLSTSRQDAVSTVLQGAIGRPEAVRRAVITEIAAAGQGARFPERELIALFGAEKKPEFRSPLVPLLGRLDSVAAARALLSSLQGSTGARARSVEGAPRYHEVVGRALGRMRSDDVRQLLLKEIRRSRSEQCLAAVVLAAGQQRLSEARDRVVALLSHCGEEVRIAALKALSRLGLEGQVAAVVRAFHKIPQSNSALRVALLDALARVQAPAGIESVLQIVAKGDPETCAIAMGSLALRVDSEEALEGLLDALEHRAREVRNAALRGLGRFRSKVMIGPLIEHLGREKIDKLRLDGLQLLIGLTGHNMGFVVDDWKKWWEVAAAKFELPKAPRGKKATAVKAHDLSYFGIEVSSKRIAFLVDASNSMIPKGRRGQGGGKSKFARMKTELTRILKALPDETFVNIMYFHKSFGSWKERLSPLQGAGRRQALAFVQELTCAFGTNIYDTLEFALKDHAVDTIYLLSDGRPVGGTFSEPEDILREIGLRNRVPGVTIHCISFAKTMPFMVELAEQNGGVHRLVK